MNIHYIRAAILDATGQKLSLEDVRDILVEEGLLTKAKAERIIFVGYNDLYKAPTYDEKKDEVIRDLLNEEIPLDEDTD